MEPGQTLQLVLPVKYGESNIVGLSRLDKWREIKKQCQVLSDITDLF